MLDQEILEVRAGLVIAPRTTPDDKLRATDGNTVAAELGGRYLLRYMLPRQVGQFRDGTALPQCATPTPYAPEETVSWLFLPAPDEDRMYVMVLDASRIDRILGPRWVRCGKGIEYLLPNGFPKGAIVAWGWEMQVT